MLWVLFALLFVMVHMYFFSFILIQFSPNKFLGSMIVNVVLIDGFADYLLVSMSLVWFHCYFCDCFVIIFWLRCFFLGWFVDCDVGIGFVDFFSGVGAATI